MSFLPHPLHPAVVHFPIVLILLGAAVALAAAFTRRWHLPVITAALLTLGAIGSVVATATGDEEEERLAETPAREAVLDRHEDWAEHTRTAAIIVAALALASAAATARWPVAARWLGAFTAAGAIVAVGCVTLTGHYGGQLVYRHGAGVELAAAGSNPAPGATDRGERTARHDHDDD